MQENQDLNIDLMISSALNNYLGSTRLSMDQVAKKWGVSTAMLSLVKNNKKAVGIDLGLKILRESGSDSRKRKQWLERKVYSLSQESQLVDKELSGLKETNHVKNNICQQLGQSKILLDIFLDIALAEEIGFSRNAVLKYYGQRGLLEVNTLLTAELCIYDAKYSRYYINEENSVFAYDQRSTFEIVSNLLNEQKINFYNSNFQGKLEFDVSDVTEEGYRELKKLQKEYQVKVRNVLQENQSHRTKGGIRVFAQSIISILKTTTLILIVSVISNNSFGLGGVTGTAGDDNELPVKREFNQKYSVKLSGLRKLIIKGNLATIGQAEYKFRNTHSYTKYFQNKQDAIDHAVRKQHDIALYTDQKSMQNLISNSTQRGLCEHMVIGKGKNYNKNFFRFNGFSIKEDYDLHGQVRYRARINLDVLCKKK